MRLRIGLTWRLGLIVVVAFLALWLVVVSIFYIGQGAERAVALPTPGGLSALAKAVERTRAEDRALILTAMQTGTRSVRVVPERTASTVLPPLWPADAATLEGYVEALRGRPLAVVPQRIEGPFRMGLVSAFNAVEFRVGLKGGETLIVRSTSPVVVAPIGLPLGFGGGVLAVVIALGALLLLNREIRPLADLAAALDRFDPDDAPEAPPPIRARSPEIRALIAAFGRLGDRLTTLTRARMALIGGVQHDIRNFATRLRLRVESIPDDDQRARAEADIADMITLLDDALMASRAGADALEEVLLEPFPIISAEIDDRRAAGAAAKLTADPEAETATMLGDRLALRRIVANIVDNALRYGDAAHAALTVETDEIVLMVDDDGPGVSPDQRAFLLEPFTRLETSRSRETGGTGLGLAVASNLAAAQGGSLEIAEAPTGGARLIFRAPAFRVE